ncbi:glycosyltransferase [bacterium]|nr:glycosyltransferase [bacterium]
MDISLYIPCYNASHYIDKVLDGVLNQNVKPKEVIVIDDGSKDNVTEIVSRYPVRLIKHEYNKGLGASRNRAIKESKYDFIASLDADCMPHRDWLKELVETFTLVRKNIGGVGGNLIEAFAVDRFDVWRSLRMHQDFGGRKIKKVKFIFGSNTLFRKEALFRSSGYNEELKTNYEDIDISTRLRKLGYDLYFNPRALAYHLRKDNLYTLLDSFWRWQFEYYYRNRYYNNKESLIRKIKDSIWLANRFLEEDLLRNNFSLLYIDFIMAFFLFLKDLQTFSRLEAKQDIFFYSPSARNYYLPLLDLVFFSKYRVKKGQMLSLLKPPAFFQNLLVFLITVVFILKKQTLLSKQFILQLLQDILSGFTNLEGKDKEALSFCIYRISKNDINKRYLDSQHPFVKNEFIKYFSQEYERWLMYFKEGFPIAFKLIATSQFVGIKNKGGYKGLS